MENHDQGIADSCKTFFHDFLQKCMYLEMCLFSMVLCSGFEKVVKVIQRTRPSARSRSGTYVSY